MHLSFTRPAPSGRLFAWKDGFFSLMVKSYHALPSKVSKVSKVRKVSRVRKISTVSKVSYECMVSKVTQVNKLTNVRMVSAGKYGR